MRAAVLLLLLGASLSAACADAPRLRLTIAGVAISAEVVETPQARARGLMHRKQLPKDEGMLFIFPHSDYHAMWMQDTFVPLSVAFIDASGVILNIEDMAPQTTSTHAAAAPAKFALEMNRGWFTAHGVKPGARIHDLPGAAHN